MSGLPCRRIAVALLSVVLCLIAPVSSWSQDEGNPRERKVVNKVVPVYPELARRMQMTGTVRVEAVVSPNGKVRTTHLIGGSPVLAQAAVEAIEKWRWEPATDETKELIELRFHP